MINTKYLELINKDIDKIITKEEKDALMKFLGENHEAELFYREMHESEEMLNNLTDREPSEDLKDRILDAVNYLDYKPEKRNISEYLRNTFKHIKSEWSLSFSLGLAAGIVLLFITFSVIDISRTPDEQFIYGTVGLNSAELSRSIPIKAEGITGKIDLVKGYGSNSKSHFVFNIDLSAVPAVILELQYNPEHLKVENFSSESLDPVNFENKKGGLRIALIGSQKFSIITTPSENYKENIELNIYNDNRIVFSEKIYIK